MKWEFKNLFSFLEYELVLDYLVEGISSKKLEFIYFELKFVYWVEFFNYFWWLFKYRVWMILVEIYYYYNCLMIFYLKRKKGVFEWGC